MNDQDGSVLSHRCLAPAAAIIGNTWLGN